MKARQIVTASPLPLPFNLTDMINALTALNLQYKGEYFFTATVKDNFLHLQGISQEAKEMTDL